MSIAAKDIKKLRELSGAGMQDCQKALKESKEDIKKAIEILRKKGIAKASKRSGREAKEGMIMVGVNAEENEGYMVELNAETDFVVRSDKFQEFANKIFSIIKEHKPNSREKLFNLSFENGTVQNALENLSGIIGEKLDISQLEILTSDGTVGAYSHMRGKIGVLVAIGKTDESDLAHNIAMQIAAANPKYLSSEDVPADEINKEKEIYKEQLIKSGKPENILAKIIKGKLNKYFKEITLLKQEYIKDDKKIVEEVLGEIKIKKYVRYSLV
ncbi:MAG: translation elongation factor Ts [Patescibacteria group bacterium]|nr:translation elongation factor Ts [Patescibacteria group bacterium]